jgi:diketogulonate reductase-like aldo/keto reductase
MKCALIGALAVAASGKVNVPTTEIAPGVQMPIVSIGTWTSDGHAGEDASKIVGNWLGQGGLGIDTALVYGDQAKVAKAIADSGLKREEVFITTKIPGCGAAQASINQDLKQLNTSYIDLLLIHNHAGGSCSNTWKVLEDNVKNGKLKSIGISNFNAKNIEDLMKDATITPAVNQIQYNVFSHDEDVIAACRANKITVEAYSPLAPPYSGKSVLKEPTVTDIAKAHNVSAFQVALKWIAQRGDTLTVLSSNAEHQASDADLWSFTLADDEMTKLGAIQKSHVIV